MKYILRIFRFTSHFWPWYFLSGSFIVSISLLSLAVPFLTKNIVDIIVSGLKGQTSDISQIFFLLGLIIIVDLTVSLLTSISQWIGDLLTVKLQTFLSQRFYRHVLSLDIGYFDNEITGKITNKMFRGITSITQFVQTFLNNFLPFFLTALVTIIILGFYSPLISLLLGVLFPVYILISHGSTIHWMKHEKEKNIINDNCQGRAYESISGIRVIKAFLAQKNEIKRYVKARNDIDKITLTQSITWHIYDFTRRILLNVIFFSIFSYIVFTTFRGQFSLGEMTLLIQLVNQARFPLFAMSFILGQIQQANSGSSDYFDVLGQRSNILDTGKKLLNSGNFSIKNAIEFRSVDFSYKSTKNVLNKISFDIAKGERIALVGESGEGKSTIVNLLLRYYEKKAGDIRIFGLPIEEITIDSLRANISVVFQDALLFSGSVMENIKIGKPSATANEVIKAAKYARAHEFIMKLDKNYDAVVGERGVKLSGGQKQRIAIARAILKDAPVIILDEATSNLDSKSETLVQEGFEALTKEKTSIIIAHRLSTIQGSDKIIVISKGKVAESGTSEELVRIEGGLYRELYNLQQKLSLKSSEEISRELKKFDIIS